MKRKNFLDYVVKEESEKGISKYKLKDIANICGKIPGLETTMIPQGVCAFDDYILVTAYDSEKKKKSHIYVISCDDTWVKTLIYPYINHVGGIAYDGNYVYVCNSTKKTVTAISRESMYKCINSVDGKTANIDKYKILPVKTTASYCTFFDGYLWVGTFERKTEGEVYGYSVDYLEDELKFKSKNIHMKVPRDAQGITFTPKGKKLYFSVMTSYGRSDFTPSYMYIYEGDNYKLGSMYKKFRLPPMGEGICTVGKEMLMIFESGADKYKNMNLLQKLKHGLPTKYPVDSVLSVDVNKLL